MSSNYVGSNAPFNWSTPEFGGDYITWAEGVEVVGEVTAIGIHTFEANERGPGRTVPKLTVDTDAGPKDITCGAADLRKKVIAAAPQVGDRVRISVIGSTKTQVGTQFFFRVEVQRKPSLPNTAVKSTEFTANDAVQTSAYPEEAPF